ncbi:MAG: PaaI family thioesterase [Verrucomicrobiota bacterium]
MTTRMTAIAIVNTDLPAPTATALNALHDAEHSGCFACGAPDVGPGLGLRFCLSTGSTDVAAEWRPPVWAAGYGGTVHGGLIATVLDSAMVHALFARGLLARTADLHIRYRHLVLPAAPCRLAARLLRVRGAVFELEATLHQAGRLCARATSRFMQAPGLAGPSSL